MKKNPTFSTPCDEAWIARNVTSEPYVAPMKSMISAGSTDDRLNMLARCSDAGFFNVRYLSVLAKANAKASVATATFTTGTMPFA